jgi:hypothetical protein
VNLHPTCRAAALGVFALKLPVVIIGAPHREHPRPSGAKCRSWGLSRNLDPTDSLIVGARPATMAKTFGAAGASVKLAALSACQGPPSTVRKKKLAGLDPD